METRQQIVTEARTWIGTPFRHAAGVKGHGADCVHIVSGTFEALGLVRHTVFPVYGMDWYKHEASPDHIVDGLVAAGMHEISSEEAGAGDVAVLKFGRKWSHCVILTDDGRGIEAWPSKDEVAEVKLKEEKLWKKSEKRYFTVI